MPSPFPGMDPYLEEPAQWPGVHQRLFTYAADALQASLRPQYHVLIGERVYIAEPPQNFYPDVTLLQRPRPRQPSNSSGYADFIDYRRSPTPPLGFSDAEWAELWSKGK